MLPLVSSSVDTVCWVLPHSLLPLVFSPTFINIQDDSRSMTDKRDNDNGEEKSGHGSITLFLGHLADGSQDEDVQNCQNSCGDQCHH